MNGLDSSSPADLSSGSGYVEPPVRHEACQLLFFLGSEFLGQSDFDPAEVPQLNYRRRYSLAYFCPTCGEVWGRLVLLREDGRTGEFDVVPIGCERHPIQRDVPGSFLDVFQGEGYIPYLPEPALRREMMLHFREVDDVLANS